jgi:hypothetical protein
MFALCFLLPCENELTRAGLEEARRGAYPIELSTAWRETDVACTTRIDGQSDGGR